MKRILCLLSLVLALPALADLVATVQPGYTFRANERPDSSKLNRLGQPTITISGTIGGTNAGLAAGSVNATHLADTTVDTTNITFRLSPRALTLALQGVWPGAIHTDVAGAGLLGGAGAPLRVHVDTNTLTIDGDVVKVSTGLSNVNISATADIEPTKLAWTTNSVIGGSQYGTNTSLSLSNLTVEGNTLVAFGPKASVLFDGDGTILSSNNVSSVTKDSVGDFTVNFAVALATTNYIVSAVADNHTGSGSRIVQIWSRTTSAVAVKIEGSGGGDEDPSLLNLIIW